MHPDAVLLLEGGKNFSLQVKIKRVSIFKLSVIIE